MKKLFLLLLFFSTAALVLSSVEGFAQRERWSVKTLTDGFKPDTNTVTTVTVKDIQKKKLIPVGDQDARMETEKQVVQITGTIKVIKEEKGKKGDGDYHIEVTDASMDSTFVCECVNPKDTKAKKSLYKNNFIKARKVVKTLKVGDKVTFTGVLFQDQKHGKSSPLRTRNFIEMHPILNAKRK
ncbi:MAG: hypothetical protein HY841_14170 [Bacteroidetes bacterium]|nr:hypothetical protein [Bacteroidota bacterium]